MGFAGDRNALLAELRRLGAQGLLGVALDRLEAYKKTIPLEHAGAFVTAILDVDGDLPEPRGEFMDFDADMHAARIIYWSLRREQDGGRRAEVLRTAIRDTEGLYLPVHLVVLEADLAEKHRDAKERLLTDADLAGVKQICVAKIRAAAADGRLVPHRHLSDLLTAWRDWGSLEEARTFCAELSRTPEGAVHLVGVFLFRSTSHSVDDYVSQEYWYVPLKFLEEYAHWEEIETRLQTVVPESLTERERRAVSAFGVAVRRRREGKPDLDGFRHSGNIDE